LIDPENYHTLRFIGDVDDAPQRGASMLAGPTSVRLRVGA
jgi:2'-5' RNA ligase